MSSYLQIARCAKAPKTWGQKRASAEALIRQEIIRAPTAHNDTVHESARAEALAAISIHASSASPNEVTLVQKTLEECFTSGAPRRLIGDRAYNSDRLDAACSPRHRVHCAKPQRPCKDSGQQAAAPLQAPMEDRAALCLAAKLPTHPHPL